ncbi:hypothetical protein KAI92_02100 [Candidatus Parcubacteria bacterium]|nr:hypothetical protein [Candidatus Parcubacteria bacterium]
MKYIIDANNLAGKLDLLGEENFDKLLIKRIRCYNKIKKKKIVLVFDSLDFMGDKFEDDGLTIIYTPRDNFYNGADDKVVEILKNEIKSKDWEGLTSVTDDVEIIQKIEKINLNNEKEIRIIKASDFAQTLKDLKNLNKDDKSLNDYGVSGLTNDALENITDEFLNIWK